MSASKRAPGCLGASGSTLKPQLVKKEPFADRDVELVEDVLKLAVTWDMEISYIHIHPSSDIDY